MSALFRRGAAVVAGLAVIAAEGFHSPPYASAGGFTRTKGECTRQGGTPQWDKDARKYWCETPDRDAECELELPDEPIAMWNVETKECEGCFLTTACVGMIGLDDDCFELETLRRFRDGVLARQPHGGADIATYYRHAPRIVAAIRNAASPKRELARIYARYILPSAIFARFGGHRLARRIYTAMMRDLAARYGIRLG